ncbi:unnamed protein product [Linum trigynum]|uniref:Uncharacterized protein n=1 Tax=Linum trigynum TaxID=586398 RepID=A0AAV2E114_9ROSI
MPNHRGPHNPTLAMGDGGAYVQVRGSPRSVIKLVIQDGDMVELRSGPATFVGKQVVSQGAYPGGQVFSHVVILKDPSSGT